MERLLKIATIYILYVTVFLPSIVIAQSQKTPTAQFSKNDSLLIEMKEIIKKGELETLRDSIRMALMQDELSQLHKTSSAAAHLRKQIEDIKANDSIQKNNQILLVNSLRNKTIGNPVTLLRDTLFSFYIPLGPFSTAHRANNATAQIQKLYEQVFFTPDSLQIAEQNGFTHIHYGNHIITSINELDAIWAEQPLDSLAINYITTIKESITYNRQLHNRQNILKRVGEAILVITIAILVYILQGFLVKKLKRNFIRTNRYLPEGVNIRNYQLLTNEQLWKYLKQLLKFFYGIFLLVFAYITLTMLFNIFPTTKNWTGTITGWLWAPLVKISHEIYDYLPNLFTIVVIVTIARYISKLIRYFSLEIERGILQIKGFYKEWARPTYKIIRILLYSFTFIIIFPYLPGSESTAFKGVSVFLGVLLSIGSSSTIANTVAGFVITYMRPFRVGDWIKIGENTGVVVEKTFLVTRMRTINNEDVTVPNSAILTGQTINYSSSASEKGLVITAEAGFAFTVPWQTIHELLIRAAKLTEGIDIHKEPYVFQKNMGDYFVTYQINAFTQLPGRMFHIQSELYQNIQVVFKNAGIDMKVVLPIDINPIDSTTNRPNH